MTTHCPICRGSGRITQTTGYYAGCPRCKATGLVWAEDIRIGSAPGIVCAMMVIALIVFVILA